jgi:hypothetical protein
MVMILGQFENISYLNNRSDLNRLVVEPFQPAPHDFAKSP